MRARRVRPAAANPAAPDGESQTFRALLEMRELLVRGEFKGGERIREVPLAARLRVSRTPLRLVLERLEQEGLLQARPTTGFVASTFSVADVEDSIELRGVLEGTAARLAAERWQRPEALDPLRTCVDELDRLLGRPRQGFAAFSRYVEQNAEFHRLLLAAANSPMLERSMQMAVALPFASPNAFVLSESQTREGREILSIAQAQHRGMLEAISLRQGARAEALAREHSRLARTNLELALRHRELLSGVPGAALITWPRAV